MTFTPNSTNDEQASGESNAGSPEEGAMANRRGPSGASEERNRSNGSQRSTERTRVAEDERTNGEGPQRADAQPDSGGRSLDAPETGRGSEADPVSVTMVSTPGDGSCGIGTYARDLTDAYDGATEILPIDQDRRSVRHFLSLAVRALRRDGDVVHVQHEYGLFRRSESPYPGVMGLVFFPLLLLGKRLTGTEVVVTMHSVLSPTPSESPFRVRLFLQVMHRLIAATSDHLVFLSADCERRFHEDVHPERPPYSVLSHGVNVGKAAAASTAEARAAFGFERTDEVVVIPGFVRPPKGHDIFVEVARELPDVEFLVAGGARPKGEDFAFAREVAEEAPDNVTITGVLADEEFPIALATADLAVLPYRVVTQSGTFNWCVAQELPILASDRPYFRRIAAEWDALETTPIDDPAAIATRVETLLADAGRRSELAENARRYKSVNSFDRVARDHYRIYRSIRTGENEVPSGGEGATSDGESAVPMSAACSSEREATATSD